MESSATGTDSLRSQLKSLTKPFHDALEATSLAMALASGTLGKKSYVGYLQALYHLHEKLETRIQNMSEWKAYHINPDSHCRLHLIAADLGALGASTQELHSKFDIHVNWSFPTAIGVLYVLEGSTMGGRLLAQRNAHILGDDGRSATRYFEAYGDETISRWGAYCEFLSRYGSMHPEENAEVILGACSMFLTMKEVLHALD
jgi:heme oxygenase